MYRSSIAPTHVGFQCFITNKRGLGVDPFEDGENRRGGERETLREKEGRKKKKKRMLEMTGEPVG